MTKQSYFLAVDVGTSSVKVVLFDAIGQQAAVHVQEYTLETPSPEIVELDPDIYWQSTQTAIRRVLADSKVAPASILSVGVTSQGETLIVLDKDGTPLRKAIVWLDNRTTEEVEQISRAFDIDEVYRITGQQAIVPTWTATKILWIRNHEPDVFKKVEMFCLVADYIIYKLTNRYVSDHAMNPSTLYYNLVDGIWWEGMLSFLDITSGQLPELKLSGTPIGTVTAEVGLACGTHVTTAPIDQVAGAIGAGNIRSGMVTETTGSAMAICATCMDTLYDPKKRVGLYRHAADGVYVLLPWVPTAGMVFRWFRDEFGGGKSYKELDLEAAAIPRGSNDLLLLPHLNGAVCPSSNPDAKGVFYGFSLAHTRGHFVRALFESVAFMLRENLDMLGTLGIPVEFVCSLGGGAQSPLWLQIKADVLNRDIVTVDTEEATCMGVAILASVAAGFYASVDEAVRGMIRFDCTYHPSPDAVNIYQKAYENYLCLNKTLLPTFGEKND